MRTPTISLITTLALVSGCSSGISQDDVDRAVADAVAEATATTTAPVTTAPTTTVPPAPTTTVERTISRSATEGDITYDEGILTEGTCTQVVREIERVARIPGGQASFMIPKLLELDPEQLPTFEAWYDDYLAPAWNIVDRVAEDHNLPLHVTAYASDVSSALGELAVWSIHLPDSYDQSSVRQWFDAGVSVGDTAKAYPTCDD